MPNSTVVVYTQVCMRCGFGKTHGYLNYIGGGKYVHFKGCMSEPKVKRVYALKQELDPISVPQCSCESGEMDIECPYNYEN